MTSYLKWLEKTVEEKLAADAIGRPLFVRLVLALTSDHGLLEQMLADAGELSGRWLRSKSLRVDRLGEAREGYLSALVEYGGGQTALLAAEVVRGEAEARVLVVGQHGTLRFDDFPEAA